MQKRLGTELLCILIILSKLCSLHNLLTPCCLHVAFVLLPCCLRVASILPPSVLPHILGNLDKCPVSKKVNDNLENSGKNVGKAYKSGESQGVIFGLEFVIITLLLCLLLLTIALRL